MENFKNYVVVYYKEVGFGSGILFYYSSINGHVDEEDLATKKIRVYSEDSEAYALAKVYEAICHEAVNYIGSEAIHAKILFDTVGKLSNRFEEILKF